MTEKKFTYAPVMTIAGSDSGGGAGIQADLKTFSALGCYGCSAITAITVQNTVGVSGIHSVPEDIVRGQVTAVIDDIQPAAIKIGMLHTSSHVIAVARTLKNYPHIPVVVDPVMIATSGDKLSSGNISAALKEYLFPLAAVVTPNLDEASILTGAAIHDTETMQQAGKQILQFGCTSVLIKGGHLKTDQLFDVWMHKKGQKIIIEAPYIPTNNTHGTGCTLSSAIAAFLAMKNSIPESIQLAHDYTYNAIDQGKDVLTGRGNGPLNHFYAPKAMKKYVIGKKG